MTFQEFAKRLGGVIKAESNTHVFVRTLFESILPEDKYDILREYSDSTFKAYYNGNANISRIAKKVNMDAQAENFADFIHNYEDPTVQKISDAFSDVILEYIVNSPAFRMPKNTARRFFLHME